MSRLLCALCLMVFLPIIANATSTSSIANTNCSGELTVSTLDGASFACAGNLTLDGGFVTSDSLINISASGDLFLNNLTFTAPNITLSVLTGMLSIGNNTILRGDSIAINGSGTSVPAAIVQGSRDSILTWSEFNIPQGGGGAVLTIGDGGDLKVGAGSGYVLNPGSNIPVVGGTLTIVGSGNLTTTGSIDNGSLISVAAVPEPSTYAMMLVGVLGLISFRRRV